MPIMNTVIAGGGSPTPTTRYGLNDKAWAGDLITDSGGKVVMRTDQAVGTLTGLSSVQVFSHRFTGSTGLVGAIDLSSVEYGDLKYAFKGTRITSLDLRRLEDGWYICGMCADNPALTSVNLSDLYNISQGGENQTGSFSQNAFENCTSLREIRLPALRLDSWFWVGYEDPETGESVDDQTAGMYSLYAFIKGCSNLVVHCSSSLGEDLENLDGSDQRANLLNNLCGGDQTTEASCSIVFDLPPNDPFFVRINNEDKYCQRRPSSDTSTNLAWWVIGLGNTGSVVYYTSGLTAPQVGDTVYSDSSCTTSAGTVVRLDPVYEYVEPEPEEEGGEEEPDEGEPEE